MKRKPIPVALSLGSNLGDKVKNLMDAIGYLSQEILQDVAISSFYRFEAVDCPADSPAYLNGAITGTTQYQATGLLTACQEIETQMGRPRDRGFHENRLIDIDILLYGDLNLETRLLTIPHPEMTEREFVLRPLADIASNWIINPGGKLVKEYLHQVLEVKS